MTSRKRVTWQARWLIAAAILLGYSTLSVHAQDGGLTPAQTNKAVQPVTRINLNTATDIELMSLPGIGPAKAKAILDYRRRVGRFRDVSEIIRVKGVGRAMYRNLKPMLTL